MYKSHIKRLLDVIIALMALLPAMPIMAVVVMALHIQGKGIMFKQVRPGYLGRPFTIYKFRSMVDAYDPYGRLLPDEYRTTPLGRIIRMTSVDELPQLLNIIRGDMSIVGPRPLLMEYLPIYTDRQNHRHDVRPGLTGWAQCRGTADMPLDEKVELDLWYIDNLTFSTDISIILNTPIKIFKQLRSKILGRHANVELNSDAVK